MQDEPCKVPGCNQKVAWVRGILLPETGVNWLCHACRAKRRLTHPNEATGCYHLGTVRTGKSLRGILMID